MQDVFGGRVVISLESMAMLGQLLSYKTIVL